MKQNKGHCLIALIVFLLIFAGNALANPIFNYDIKVAPKDIVPGKVMDIPFYFGREQKCR